MTPPHEPSALDRLRRLEQGDAARRAPSTGEPPPNGAAPPPTARRKGIVASLVAGLLLVLAKGKALLLLLVTKGGVLLSALKFGKILATLATMGASFLYYTGFYGAPFALGIIVLILVHELGHGAAARRMGLEVGAPIFIPGFGAFIALKEQPRSTWVNAVVGYGGPLAGTLGGVCVLALGPALLGPRGAGLSVALAHFTFFLNFFNLLPVGGLDGDRITEPLTTPHWIVGLIATAFVTAWAASAIERRGEGANPQVVFAILILVLGVVKAIRAHRRAARERSGEESRLVDRLVGPRAGYVDESAVTPGQRRAAAVGYFGLVAALSALLVLSQLPPR